VKLGNYVNIRTGKLDANAADVTGKYPFFTCSSEPLKINTYSFDCECVLVAGNGELNAKYYNGKFDAYQRTYVIESKDDSLYTKYLYYFFINYIKELRKQAIGGVIKYIKLGNLTDADIMLPDIETQKNIVKELSKINLEIEKCRKNLKSLEELTKSRFIELFGDPIENSKNFKTIPLKKLGILERGRSQHRPRNDSSLLNGPYPLIQTGDVKNSDTYITKYTSTYSEKGLKQSKMWKKGTLCITIAANIAETAILEFDACFPDSVVGFRPNDNVTTIFIHNWFKFLQPILEEKAPSVAQKNLNLEILGNVEVIVPKIDLQIGFENSVKQIDKLKFNVQKQIKYYQELLDLKMHEYFDVEEED